MQQAWTTLQPPHPTTATACRIQALLSLRCELDCKSPNKKETLSMKETERERVNTPCNLSISIVKMHSTKRKKVNGTRLVFSQFSQNIKVKLSNIWNKLVGTVCNIIVIMFCSFFAVGVTQRMYKGATLVASLSATSIKYDFEFLFYFILCIWFYCAWGTLHILLLIRIKANRLQFTLKFCKLLQEHKQEKRYIRHRHRMKSFWSSKGPLKRIYLAVR